MADMAENEVLRFKGGEAGAEDGGDSTTSITPRKFFPETWLWDLMPR